MTEEERFEELMRDAERTYRNPPSPDFDAMWQNIEREHFGATARPARFRFVANRWVGIAATLMLGIGIGRASISMGKSTAPETPAVMSSSVATQNVAEDPMARPYELETSKYLGQTAALLVALSSEVKPGSTNAQFTSRAAELLSRTRLLMDSPAANDPAMRNLLEDLELVLVQVVRLQGGSRTDLDLINRALEQREVIPRLRTAAADISAN
jgi:hypothetical protein